MFPFNALDVDIFGASHAPEIGVTIRGIPAGQTVDPEKVQAFVDTRKAGKNPWSTPRNEPDEVIFTQGLKEGRTTGEPVVGVIKNLSQRSKDYDAYRFTPRPSHADYVATVKDGDKAELAGGGRFSGRMTAPLCIAGGIALQLLEERGIAVEGYVYEIGGIQGKSYRDGLTRGEIENAEKIGRFAPSRAEEMIEAVLQVREQGDSLGGSVECVVYGLPVGLGDALFGGMESKIASAVFAVPAVKSVEFGLGAEFSGKRGSEANDPFTVENGKVTTVTNHSGGLNGGITNGMPLTLRVTLRPTPSIALPQKTVDLRTGEPTESVIKGRHDACVVPRAVAGLKSAVALALLDALLEENKF